MKRVVLTLLAALVLLAALHQRQPDTLATQLPGAASLSIAPAQSVVGPGESFEVEVRLDSREWPVDGAQVSLSFDPAYLRVEMVSPGVTLPLLLGASPYVDNEAGYLGYGAGLPLGAVDFPSGPFTLATVRLTALQQTTTTAIVFLFDAETGRMSRVSWRGEDLLIGPVTEGAVTIVESDTTPPSITELHPVDGATILDNTSLIGASYLDDSGVNPASVRLWLNGTEITALAAITATGLTYTPSAPLDYGPHSVEIYLEDSAGNAANASWSFSLLAMHTYDLPAGWSLISLPVVPPDPSTRSLFGALSYFAVYAWDARSGTYQAAEQLEPGLGYWFFTPEPGQVEVVGMPVTAYSLDVGQGWIMIGAPATAVAIEDAATEPAGVLFRWLYAWDGTANTYVLTDVLQPGAGYWALALEACTLAVTPPRSPA